MAWGLFEKRDTESISRAVSARTLDGAKVRVKLHLRFVRPIAQTEAEALMMRYARAYQRAVESELSDGTLPFDDVELQRRLTDEIRDLPGPNVRVVGLHLWQNGSPSCDTLTPISSADLARTLPSMRGVGLPGRQGLGASEGQRPPNGPGPAAGQRLPPSARAPSWNHPPGSKPRDTQPPDAEALSAPTRAAMPRAAECPPSTEAEPSGHAPTQRSVRLPRTRVSLPAWRQPSQHGDVATALLGPQVPTPRSRSQPSTGPAIGTEAPGEAPDDAELEFDSRFQRALEAEPVGSIDALAQCWAEPLSRTSVALALQAMRMGYESAPDPLSWFEAGRCHQSLIEACAACVSALLYETLLQAQVPHGSAVTTVQQACCAATRSETSAAQIGQFLGGDRSDLLRRAASRALGLDSTHLARAFEAPLARIEQDLRGCAGAFARPQRSSRPLSPTG